LNRRENLYANVRTHGIIDRKCHTPQILLQCLVNGLVIDRRLVVGSMRPLEKRLLFVGVVQQLASVGAPLIEGGGQGLL
jgi:hypothetical protein